MCSLPDPKSNLWIRVFPAGPQLQELDRSVHMPDAYARQNVIRYGIYQAAFLPMLLGNCFNPKILIEDRGCRFEDHIIKCDYPADLAA